MITAAVRVFRKFNDSKARRMNETINEKMRSFVILWWWLGLVKKASKEVLGESTKSRPPSKKVLQIFDPAIFAIARS